MDKKIPNDYIIDYNINKKNILGVNDCYYWLCV